MPRKVVFFVVVALLLGLGVGAGLVWGLTATGGEIRPEIIEGYTTAVNGAGTAVGVATEPDGPGKSYSVAGAFWREAGGAWHTEGPATCLEPLSYGQRIRLAVVAVEPVGDAPGREMVTWLECLPEDR